MLAILRSISEKNERLVVGLMSGTSKDGVDAALVRIKGAGVDTGLDILNFHCYSYKPDIRSRLENLSGHTTPAEVSELNFIIGNVFADAALSVINDAGFTTANVDLIGSHGQTVYHSPPSGNTGLPSTLQIGELDVIAERTGITTIGDFRTRDLAAGGEGAPLVPYIDYILFSEKGETRIAQNLGGIGNASLVTEDIDDVIAFDTGPGNMLMDKIVSLATGGRETFDNEGIRASEGICEKSLLKELLSDPYFEIPPPKSTGEELFGIEMAKRLFSLVESKEVSLNDLLASVLELTVESVALSYESFLLPKGNIKEVIFSGGGCENKFLMKRFSERLHPINCVISDSYGIPANAKEAIAFAILANELLSGNNANLPSVTGASRSVPMGKIVLGK